MTPTDEPSADEPSADEPTQFSDAVHRLDSEVFRRSLSSSRTSAAQLIRDGNVRVDGVVVTRVSNPVTPEARIEVTTDGWVSRGALKLDAALDAFGIAIEGRLALDAGASTGGFTQVLLRRGAARVLAIDVGHDQLAPGIAADPRVVSVEGVNVRSLTPAALAALTGVAVRPTVVTADLSFISLRQVLPALVDTAAPGADFVLLVKPQFEVGRTGVRGGIVRDAALRASAVQGVLDSAWTLGLGTAGVIASPITGAAGNHEALVHLTAGSETHPAEWSGRLQSLGAH